VGERGPTPGGSRGGAIDRPRQRARLSDVAAAAGAIVGEMAMIDESVRSATVIAKTDCKFLPIERERFNFFIQKKPEFAQHVMRVLVDRLRRTDAML